MIEAVGEGYDLLAPKFDCTPFRTSDGVLDATAGVLRTLAPFGRGLDVMYYLTCPLPALRRDLTASGLTVTTVPLTALGQRADGSPRCWLVLARKAATP
jgi:hypothetical protein